jgi:hypothetical protein
MNIVFEMSTAPENNHQGNTLIVRDRSSGLVLKETSFPGIFMENGSGGFMGGMPSYMFFQRDLCSAVYSDLVFNGGKYGLAVGNQQFTIRNVTINNSGAAIQGPWNWGWWFFLYVIQRHERYRPPGFTFQGVTINKCKVGFNLTTGGTTAATQVHLEYLPVCHTPDLTGINPECGL